MALHAQQGHSDEFNLRREAMRAFHSIDVNGDGLVSRKELSEILKRLGHPNASAAASDIIQCADRDGDAMMSFDEFVRAAHMHVGDDRAPMPSSGSADSESSREANACNDGADEAEDLRRVFSFFDQNGDGRFGADELQRAIRVLLGDEVSMDDCRRMIAKVDANGDGLVDFNEFATLMQGVFG
eukprot:TRINITY_DN37768_c0_g3_i1.p1 TRINITY_DN37768_c0_g3~~TRINITY_DN37768_c0_g3_i1.p1  ORF type:complete len:184 (-),score=10.20 TRINITY_DN37768_c0_g3_i1:456-1007(-)